jgi:hypothetical protein
MTDTKPKSGYETYGIDDPWDDLDEGKLKSGSIESSSLGGYKRWTDASDRKGETRESKGKEFLSTFRDKFKDKFRDDR